MRPVIEHPWFGTIEIGGKLWGWALLRRVRWDRAGSVPDVRTVDSLVFYNPRNLAERVRCRVPDQMTGQPDENVLRQLFERCHDAPDAV